MPEKDERMIVCAAWSDQITTYGPHRKVPCSDCGSDCALSQEMQETTRESDKYLCDACWCKRIANAKPGDPIEIADPPQAVLDTLSKVMGRTYTAAEAKVVIKRHVEGVILRSARGAKP